MKFDICVFVVKGLVEVVLCGVLLCEVMECSVFKLFDLCDCVLLMVLLSEGVCWWLCFDVVVDVMLIKLICYKDLVIYVLLVLGLV